MEDINVYVSATLVFVMTYIFSFKNSNKSIRENNAQGLVLIFNFIRFAKKNLSEEDVKKLNVILSPDFFDRSVSKVYRDYVKKFYTTELDGVLTYEELKKKEIINDDSKKYDFIWYFLTFVFLTFFSPYLTFKAGKTEFKPDNNKNNWELFITPDERERMFSMILLSFCQYISLIFIIYLICQNSWLISILGILAIIQLIFIIICFNNVINKQIYWKEKWSEIFDYIMQKASISNDHDLFNRSMNKFNAIKNISSIPISEETKTYAIVYTILQVVITFLIKHFIIKK